MRGVAFKNRVDREGPSEKVTVGQDLKIGKEQARELSWGRTT